ncbi:MAG TPA: Ldh family oxidoreductase [Dehalococcoidia bacterium]|nr:Ldh family oxidoreductase [Dehalococcoidia bacterium]
MPQLSVDQFRKFSMDLFAAAGASKAESTAVTDSLIFASLHGHDTHGAGHLPLYINNYLGIGPFGGSVNKDGKVTIVKESPATIAIDANWCLGQKVAMDATQMVIEKAKVTGIAAATMYQCTHTGALGYFVYEIVKNDMIGLAFTGAAAVSPPWGGAERMLGTNPLSIGVPAGKEYPLLIDMATSSNTWAGIGPLLASGKIPDGMLLNDDGEPSNDPRDFSRPGAEQRGAMQNMGGGHKGYALQLAVEMLGAVWPGLITGNENFATGKFNNPTSIIAINVSFFQDLQAFKDKIDSRIREIKSSKKKSGVDEILIPGERGFKAQERRVKEGIPIIDHYWHEIVGLAEKLNVPLPEGEPVH